MLLWQTFHNIPFDTNRCPVYYAKIFTTASQDNIWLVSECKTEHDDLRIELAVFETKSLEVTKLDYKVDIPSEYGLYGIASSHKNLYFLWCKFQQAGLADYKLCKLDTITMKYENVLDFEKMRLSGQLQVVGDDMFCLDVKNNKDRISLIRIDLSEKVVESTLLSEEHDNNWQYDMLLRNGRKYIMKYTFNNRKIFFINDKNGLEKLCHDDYIEKDRGCVIHTDWIDGRLLVQQYRDLFWDTFDFDNNEWHREMTARINNTIDMFYAMPKSAVAIDQKVYVVLKRLIRDDAIHSFGVINIKPQLKDICLLQLVDELAEEKDEKNVESSLKKIPITMRKRFINTVIARKAPHERRLIEKMYLQFVAELNLSK